MSCIEQLKSVRDKVADPHARYVLDKAIAALTAEQEQGGATTPERTPRPAEEHAAPVDDELQWTE